MPIRVAPLVVSEADRTTLEGWLRSPSMRSGLARRARIVLLAAEALSNTEIAQRVGVSRPTVLLWRGRYEAAGVGALDDLERSGRPRRVEANEVVAATLTKPPDRLGVTHWSSRLLAKELGIGNATVAKIWRRWDLQPWRVETFKFSTDPELDAKIRDVVGLYMNPPENAVVVCIDEKTQIQALDRTAPILPMRPGVPDKQTHDYKRNGTTSLFAALEVATGKVTDACYERHTNVEFLAFLKVVAKAYPRRELHVVCDNYATHEHPNVKAWLAKNPRVTLHFTPTSGSWLNMVEIFFGITRQAIRREPSTRSATSRTPSARSSPAGTTAANRSSGPKTRKPSWRRSSVNELPTRDNSSSDQRIASSGRTARTGSFSLSPQWALGRHDGTA